MKLLTEKRSCRKGRRPFRRKRAIMLILVLWVVAVMSILAYSVIYQMTLETRLTSIRKKTLTAKALARAGIAKGFVDLRNDLIIDHANSAESPPFDALGDVWALTEDKTEATLGRRTEGTFTVDVVDADRFLNINQFNASKRVLLEKVIVHIGYNEDDARIVASAIIDYADSDDQPVLDSAVGDEGLAYGLIRAEAEGTSEREEDVERLVFPNERYMTVESLLDVYGVTPELYFGPGTPEAEYYREMLGPAITDRFQIEGRVLRRRSEEEILGLRDFFTVHGSGNLNLNTAPQHVLAVLIEAAQGGVDGERVAESIIRNRAGGRGRRPDNDDAFKTMADAQRLSELAALLGPMQAFHGLNVVSSEFILTSTGRSGDVSQTLSVIVQREMRQFQINETFEQVDRARERLKLYEDRRERGLDKETEQLVNEPMVRIVQWLDN